MSVWRIGRRCDDELEHELPDGGVAMMFDSSRRLRRIRQERWAEATARQRQMFDRSRGEAQDRLVEVVEEFERLSSEQKALMLRQMPTFYFAAARLSALSAVLRKRG